MESERRTGRGVNKSMVSETLTIINRQGLHMRPAGTFVRAMAEYQSDLTILFNGRRINGKSIMQVMTACIKCGAELELECSGPDEQEMLRAAAELINSGLGDEI